MCSSLPSNVFGARLDPRAGIATFPVSTADIELILGGGGAEDVGEGGNEETASSCRETSVVLRIGEHVKLLERDGENSSCDS